MEHDVAGCVAVDVQHVKALLPHGERVTFVQIARGRKCGTDGEAVFCGGLRQALQQKFVFAVRPEDVGRVVLQQEGHAACVVQMSVREPDGAQVQPLLLDVLPQEAAVAADIGQHGVVGGVVPQQGAVLAEGGDGEDSVLECHGKSVRVVQAAF